MKISKWMAAASAALGLLVSGGACSGIGGTDCSETIRLGVVLPLSGDNAVFGRRTLEGMELAVQEINRDGGVENRPLELIVRDSGGQPEKSAEAFRALAGEGAAAVVGGYATPEALAMKPVAEELKLPLIVSQSTGDAITEDAEYVFRACFNDSMQSAGLAYYLRYIRKINVIGVMINLDRDGLYSRDLGRKVAQRFVDLGGRMPRLAGFSEHDGNFDAALAALMADRPEAIVMPCYPRTAARFVKAARQAGFTGLILGSDSYDGAALYADRTVDPGDCAFSAVYSRSTTLDGGFARRFEAAYRHPAGDCEALGYDSVRMAAKAARGASASRALAANLREMKTYPSVCGRVYQGRNGELLKPVYMMELCNGQLKAGYVVDAQALEFK